MLRSLHPSFQIRFNFFIAKILYGVLLVSAPLGCGGGGGGSTPPPVNTGGDTTGLAASGYPKPGADLAGTGFVQGSGAKGTLAWRFDLGQSGVGSPVLGPSNLLFAINQDGVIFALDATTGQKKWQKTALASKLYLASLVAGANNTLFVGTRGGVEAYDMTTGGQKWTNTAYSVDALMTLNNNKLYVPTANQGIAVLDTQTGSSQTPLPAITGDPAIPTYTYDPAIANGMIFYVSESYSVNPAVQLFVVNLSTGQSVWGGGIGISPAVHYNGTFPVISPAGILYLSAGDGSLLAWDAQNGMLKAQRLSVVDPIIAQPSIGPDGSVTFLGRDADTQQVGVMHYDAGLQTRLWMSPIQLNQTTVGADGTLYGAGPYAGTDPFYNTAIYALNGNDGTVKWKFPLTLGNLIGWLGYSRVPNYVAVGPTGMVYYVSIDHQVYAIK